MEKPITLDQWLRAYRWHLLAVMVILLSAVAVLTPIGPGPLISFLGCWGVTVMFRRRGWL